jgi:hypothetical protein
MLQNVKQEKPMPVWAVNNPGINPIVTKHIPLCKTLRRFYLSAVAEAFAKFFNLN